MSLVAAAQQSDAVKSENKMGSEVVKMPTGWTISMRIVVPIPHLTTRSAPNGEYSVLVELENGDLITVRKAACDAEEEGDVQEILQNATKRKTDIIAVQELGVYSHAE